MQNADFEYGFGPAIAPEPDLATITSDKPEEKPVAVRRGRGRGGRNATARKPPLPKGVGKEKVGSTNLKNN